jgi:hypothetical protein
MRNDGSYPKGRKQIKEIRKKSKDAYMHKKG